MLGTDAGREGGTSTDEVEGRELLALDALGKLIRDEDVQEELVAGEIDDIERDVDITLVVVASFVGCRLLFGSLSLGIIENDCRFSSK